MIKFFIITVFLYTSLFSISPQWYLNLDRKPNIIFGYGKDINPQKAKKLAKRMIRLRVDHKLIPQYLKLLKQSTNDGITYVAYSYNTQSLVDKIYKKKDSITSSNSPNNILIENSSIYRNIIYKLNLKPKIQLLQENLSWYLQINKNKFYLDILTFPQLFSNIKNKELQFHINKRTFQSPDNIQFKIKSKHTGYISILYSSPYGKVRSLVNNDKITTQEFIYPKKNTEKLIILNNFEHDIKELYIAIFSKKPLDLQDFIFVNEDALLDGSNYNFDKLLQLIQNNSFSTIKVRIKSEKEL